MMKIEIKKEYVYDEAGKITAYIGAKNGRYEQTAITVNEHQALDTFWRDGCNNVISMLKKFMTGISPINMHHPEDAEVLEVTVNVPHIDTNMEQTIISAITVYLINYVVSQWLNVCSWDEAKIYEAKAGQAVEMARRMIYERKIIRYEEN